MNKRQKKKKLRKDYAPFIHYKRFTIREMRKLDDMLLEYGSSFKSNKQSRDAGGSYIAITEWRWIQSPLSIVYSGIS